MRRMAELLGVPANGPSPAKAGEELGDVRVRVDFHALARAVGPKAMRSRTRRVVLYGGAVTVEAFNIRKASNDSES